MPEIIKNIPEALLIFCIFYVVTYFLDKVLTRVSKHHDTGASEVFRLLSNSQRTVLLVIGVIVAIGKLGFDVSALVAGLGLTGFAVGFALKDAISNLVAGFMIVIYRPFEIDDEIEISGSKGIVIDMNLRHVTIESDVGLCLVPNSLFLNTKLMRKKVENIEEDK